MRIFVRKGFNNPRLTVIIGFFLLVLAGGVSSDPAEADRGIEVGEKIPQRVIRTRTMDEVSVPSEEGLTVLVFWATWSPRSQPALEAWNQFARDYSDHNITVLAANADHQHMEAADIAKVDAFLADHEIDLPAYIDDNLVHFNEIGVIVLPTTLFFEPDGTLVYKMGSFPTSARLDLQEELEVRLGIRQRRTEEETASRGKLEYEPKNNAMLHYNLGRRLHEKGMEDKARDRYLIALEKDPDYADPLRALEGIFFAEGRTAEAEESLRALLADKGLAQVAERIGEGEPLVLGREKKADPMERMRQLMGASPPPVEEEQKEK
ncbi:MAG: redoxin domain-containing protein [bacterium]|nr:MAG: redoxin domain-containing protein [bacterium]